MQRERDRAERSISDDEIAALLQSIPPKDMLPVLVASFCPQIYGQALVKLGILLTLFGSSTAARGGGAAAVRVRADPHMLLVGDPGLGKSQLITAAAAIAPRGIYVCGNTSTASGLTATLHHESSSNSTGGSSYALEAGALVLADTGVCCIDEFDKIGDQQRVLLEVMEQQMVHVAKAGIVCSLPARASILAAANPVGGHYNRAKGLLANLKMDPALLSRFDLVYVLLDKPDAGVDRMLSEQVLGNFAPAGAKISTFHHPAGCTGEELADPVGAGLKARLRPKAAHRQLTAGELRRIIAYARASVQPRMTPEAGGLLQQFYLGLRQQNKTAEDLLPITTRHLEAMIRLAEARARIEMRPVVEVSDAQDVIDLMTHCMFEFLAPAAAPAGAAAGRKGAKAGKGALLKRYVQELIQISASTGGYMFTDAQLRELHDALEIGAVYPLGELIDALNQYGHVLKKGPGRYKLCVT